MQTCAFKINCTEKCSLGSNWWYGRIGSDNGLVPNRWQAINWINDGMLYLCIYASLGVNELTGYDIREKYLQNLPFYWVLIVNYRCELPTTPDIAFIRTDKSNQSAVISMKLVFSTKSFDIWGYKSNLWRLLSEETFIQVMLQTLHCNTLIVLYITRRPRCY